MKQTLMERVLGAVVASIDRVRNRNYWMHLNGNLVWTGVDSRTREVENTDPRSILDSLHSYLAGVRPQKTVTEYIEEIKAWATEKGWEMHGEHEIPEKLLLIVTEVAEAMEEYRKAGMSPSAIYYNEGDASAKPEGLGIELADAVIRIFHLAGDLNIDLEEAIEVKMAFNQSRPYRHGGKRA